MLLIFAATIFPTELPALRPKAKDTATVSPPPRTLLEVARKPEPDAAASPGERVVSGDMINLDYAVKDTGASGVTDVEVSYTRDGKSWDKHSATSPSPSRQVVRVDGEGRHGPSDVREVDHEAAPPAGVPDGDADGKGDARAGDDGGTRHGHVLEDAMGRVQEGVTTVSELQAMGAQHAFAGPLTD